MKLTIQNIDRIKGGILDGQNYVWQLLNVTGNEIAYCFEIHLVEKKVPFKNPPMKIEYYLDRQSTEYGRLKLYNMRGQLHHIELGSETIKDMNKFCDLINYELQKIG